MNLKRYRILTGTHCDFEQKYLSMSIADLRKLCQEQNIALELKDREGRPVKLESRADLLYALRAPSTDYRAGVAGRDIIETEVDMLQFNGKGMSPKFALLDQGQQKQKGYVWDPESGETIEQFAARVKAQEGVKPAKNENPGHVGTGSPKKQGAAA